MKWVNNLLPSFVDLIIFIFVFWDRSPGRLSRYLRACFASCCPVSPPRAPSSASSPTAGCKILCDCHSPLTVSLFLFLFQRCLWASLSPPPHTLPWCFGERGPLCGATTNGVPLSSYPLTAGPETLPSLILFDAIFVRETCPAMEVALWARRDFPFIQITEKPVKWFISSGKLRETWVPLKNIALDSLFKNKVIKLGFFWSPFSSGLTGLSLQPH